MKYYECDQPIGMVLAQNEKSALNKLSKRFGALVTGVREIGTQSDIEGQIKLLDAMTKHAPRGMSAQ